MNNLIKLRKSFYERDNVVEIAKDLLGKYLFTNINGELTGGKIVETEAYNGLNDRACHAYQKRTPRTEVMYGEGGKAYVYLCYGIHHLFNIVTNKKGYADAVLIRGLQPVEGINVMKERLSSIGVSINERARKAFTSTFYCFRLFRSALG